MQQVAQGDFFGLGCLD